MPFIPIRLRRVVVVAGGFLLQPPLRHCRARVEDSTRAFTTAFTATRREEEQEEEHASLPSEVARRLALFHEECARQQQQQQRPKQETSFSSRPVEPPSDPSAVCSSSSYTAPPSNILDVKQVKKLFSDDSDLRSRDSARRVYWHSAAHVLGQAIELCLSPPPEQEKESPDAAAVQRPPPLLCDGPPLVGDVADQGFYYQFALPDGEVVSEEDLMRIEREMQKIVREKQGFERLEVSRSFARSLFQENIYKLDMLERIPDTEPVTVFRNGPFVDLCRGPHVTDTSAFGAIKVLSSSAAHFRSGGGGAREDGVGDGTDHARGLVPVQRIYGIAFPKPKQLRAWEKQIKLAHERDHRTIGTAQELFMFDKSSPGSPFFLPHGTRILNRVLDQLRIMYWKDGYEEVRTPLIFNKDLWDQSGHLANYADDMYGLKEGLSPIKGDVEDDGMRAVTEQRHRQHDSGEIGLKPMNCPAHYLMFGARNRSYREMPIRLADFGSLHRNENTGSLRGLTRVRCLHQDDAHIFCRPDQMQQEVAACLEFIDQVYSRRFGLTDLELRLSTRPPKRVGSDEIWDRAEEALVQALETWGRPYALNEGDGAFYGPKIDVRVGDALGRWHQCATVQLDFNLPDRFDLSYEDASGSQRPVIVHRAVLGSLERMVAILCEHWGGRWPLWISPRQVAIVPVNDSLAEHALAVQQKLRDVWSSGNSNGHVPLHDEIMDGKGTLKKRISAAQRMQYNYILVIGEKEATNGTVNVRTRNGEVMGEVEVQDFVALLQSNMRRFE